MKFLIEIITLIIVFQLLFTGKTGFCLKNKEEKCYYFYLEKEQTPKEELLTNEVKQ